MVFLKASWLPIACREGPRICNIRCRGFHKVEHLLQEEISPLLDFAHRGRLLFPHLHHAFSSTEAAHVLERFFLLLFFFLACEILAPQLNWSGTPCTGSAESSPLDHHQWSPLAFWANLSRVFYYHFRVCLRKTLLTIKPERRPLPLGQRASQFWFHPHWNLPRFDYNSGMVEGWPTHLGCSRAPLVLQFQVLNPGVPSAPGKPGWMVILVHTIPQI